MVDSLPFVLIWLVAPFAGAWIEIIRSRWELPPALVAPFAGAWIEIRTGVQVDHAGNDVAPFAGAWIEMYASEYLIP